MSLLNYIKQIWDTTSYVNPTRMNHIEDGIYAVSDKVDNNLDDTEVKHGNTTVNAVLNNLKYENLITEITLTASQTTTQNLISGKKFSDYNMISVIFYDSEYIRGSAVLSRNGTNGRYDALVPTLYSGTVSTNIIKESSDTVIYLDNRANTTLKVMVRGIKIT